MSLSNVICLYLMIWHLIFPGFSLHQREMLEKIVSSYCIHGFYMLHDSMKNGERKQYITANETGVSERPTKYIEFISYHLYHFVYNLKFSVLVRINMAVIIFFHLDSKYPLVQGNK